MIQTIELNLIPNGIPAVIYGTQWDQKRKFKCKIYEGTEQFIITAGMDITLNGRKPDGTVFLYTRDDGVIDWQTGKNEVTVTTALQVSAAVGETECQLRFTGSDESDLGTVNFTLEISEMPADDEEGISKSELPSIIAQAKAQEAACRVYAETCDDLYHDTLIAANNAEASALRSAESAEAAKDSEDNAKASEEAAAHSAEIAETLNVNPPRIGWNGNWWLYNTTEGKYIDSGIDASITVDIADVTMLPSDADPYVTNTGTDTDPVFHLFLPTGVSAYEIVVAAGYTGTEQQFAQDLMMFDQREASARQNAIYARQQADRAEMYADFVTPHFIIQNNRLYIKEDAQLEFTVANNRLYLKAA